MAAIIGFKKIKGFPLKVKSFQITATYQKLRGGVPSIPPSPLYHSRGMNLRLRPSDKIPIIPRTLPLLYTVVSVV